MKKPKYSKYYYVYDTETNEISKTEMGAVLYKTIDEAKEFIRQLVGFDTIEEVDTFLKLDDCPLIIKETETQIF